MDSLFLIPLSAGALFCLVAGPLGSFMIWKRLAFFGDVLAHATLLGLALGLGFSLPPLGAVCVVALVLGVFMSLTREDGFLSKDTWLSLFSQGALALGLVAFSLFPKGRFSLSQALFGDLLAMGPSDVLIMVCVLVPAFFVLLRLWTPLLMVTLHEDLAAVQGVRVQNIRTAFMVVLALCIGVTSTYFGILLLSAMLILPAVIARFMASNATAMAFLASLLGFGGFVGGLLVSNTFDTPVGASVVLVHLCVLVVVSLMMKQRQRTRSVAS